ncbi:uncharacterized protein [Nicotiana tomentosiformis]|uniref:uncharacterized protein n=1 Tax=Nicotiana tomentosiformis TaxID=4098 RepID=UPI00388CDB1A
MSSEGLLRLDNFTKLFPVHFSGSPSEDPQDYLDRWHEVLRNMGIVETNRVDFAVFQMMSFAKRWWKDFVLTRQAGSPDLTWDQLSKIFLEKFLVVTLIEDFRRQFKRLQKVSMSFTQYETCFVDLAHHAILLLPTERERVRRFIEGLAQPIKLQMAKVTGSEISFQAAANVARGHPPRPFHSALQASHIASGGRSPHMPYSNQLAYSAPPAPISAPPLQSFQGGYSGRQGQFQGQQSQQPRSCYTYGDPRHIARFCPRASSSSQHQGSRAMVSAPGASPPAYPARGRGQAARGGGQAVRGGG